MPYVRKSLRTSLFVVIMASFLNVITLFPSAGADEQPAIASQPSCDPGTEPENLKSFEPHLARMVFDFAQGYRSRSTEAMNEAARRHSWSACPAGTKWKPNERGEYACLQGGVFSDVEIDPDRYARIEVFSDNCDSSTASFSSCQRGVLKFDFGPYVINGSQGFALASDGKDTDNFPLSNAIFINFAYGDRALGGGLWLSLSPYQLRGIVTFDDALQTVRGEICKQEIAHLVHFPYLDMRFERPASDNRDFLRSFDDVHQATAALGGVPEDGARLSRSAAFPSAKSDVEIQVESPQSMASAARAI